MRMAWRQYRLFFEVYVKANATDAGYSSGDMVQAMAVHRDGSDSEGPAVWADSTNIGFATGSNIKLRAKGTPGALSALTGSKWNIVFRVWP